MAERPGGEPTEEPTPKRLADARRRGQIAKSRDLTGAAAFSGALIGFAATARASGAALRGYLGEALAGATRSGPLDAGAALRSGVLVGARVVLPIAVLAALAAAMVGGLQAGGLFTLSPLAPSLERVSPLAGLRRIFSKQAGIDLLQSLAKLVGVGLIAWWLLTARAAELAGLAARAPAVSLGVVGAAAMALALRVAVLFAAVGAVELVLARRALLRGLRMTRYEVLRELRETEGDPHHKAERQRVLGEITDHERSLAVAAASCVIVGEQLAVALAYPHDPVDDEAPRVTAIGERLLGARLRQLAQQHRIPIHVDVALARALADLGLEREIPASLYEPVAAVLRAVAPRAAA